MIVDTFKQRLNFQVVPNTLYNILAESRGVASLEMCILFDWPKFWSLWHSRLETTESEWLQ